MDIAEAQVALDAAIAAAIETDRANVAAQEAVHAARRVLAEAQSDLVAQVTVGRVRLVVDESVPMPEPVGRPARDPATEDTLNLPPPEQELPGRRGPRPY